LSREEFIKLREKKMKEIGVDPKHQPGKVNRLIFSINKTQINLLKRVK